MYYLNWQFLKRLIVICLFVSVALVAAQYAREALAPPWYEVMWNAATGYVTGFVEWLVG